jgi:hypothetical protein
VREEWRRENWKLKGFQGRRITLVFRMRGTRSQVPIYMSHWLVPVLSRKMTL